MQHRFSKCKIKDSMEKAKYCHAQIEIIETISFNTCWFPGYWDAGQIILKSEKNTEKKNACQQYSDM